MASRSERLLDAQAETARTINRLMLTLLGLGLVGTLTLGFPDSYLLTTATTVSIPFAGAASFKALLVLGPVLLIAVRVYLEVYLSHWRRLNRMTERQHVARTPVVSPLRHPLLKLFAFFVLYLLVPLVLAVFTWEAMVFREWAAALLYVTVASSTVLLFLRLPWGWFYRFVAPPLALLAIFVTAEYDGAFESFRRPLQLQFADLSRTVLSEVDLRGANLERADLRSADLRRASLQRAYLVETNLRLADLRGANLSESTLFGASLQNAYLHNTDLQGAKLSQARLQGARMWRANLQKANLRFANLQGTTLNVANLQEAILSDANLQGASLRGADLQGAHLARANLRDADLQKAHLNRANLQEAVLRGTDLQEAILVGADVQKADLTGANLSGSYLSKTEGLTQEQLDDACGDENTTLPEGLTIKTCEEAQPEQRTEQPQP
jgi:uncharacterized protein YjbI with pentapeptide repeats